MPTLLDAPPEGIPQTKTDRRRLRFRLPWTRTAVSAPTDDEDLLVVNETEVSWTLALGYRQLGVLGPKEHRRYHVLKLGMLTARRNGAPTGEEYLMLHISPAVEAVRIVQLAKDLALFELQEVQRHQAAR